MEEMKKFCDRCNERYDVDEIYRSKYFKNSFFCIPCEREYERKLESFRIKFMYFPCEKNITGTATNGEL